MAGQRNRFLADAFHEIAVGGEHIGGVIDDVAAEDRREMTLRNCHADGVGQALAERAGGGFDAGGVAMLGMTGRKRAELAEALDLLDRHLRVAEQIKQRVEQHRAVAGREHETVAVGPGRIGRIEFEEAGEQHGRDIGRAHRQAGMARFRLLDRVHRESANRVRHAVVIGARSRAGSGKTRRLGESCARRGKTVRLGHGDGQSRRQCAAAAVMGTGGAQITWGEP